MLRYIYYTFNYELCLSEIHKGYALLRRAYPTGMRRFIVELVRIACFFNLQVTRFFAFLARSA